MKPLVDATGRVIHDEAELIVYEETPLYTPPGKVKGLKPRSESLTEESRTPGKVCGFFSDLARARQFDIIPPQDWGMWIEKGAGDQSEYVWDILDQDGVGSCAAEDATQNIMIRREIGGQPRVKLNPWGMYWSTSGGYDGGSSHPDNLAYAREHGVPSQAVRPRSKGWSAKPTEEERADALKHRIEEFYEVQNTAELGTAFLMGFTAILGYQGHSVPGVKLLNTLQFGYPNSWDESWGDNGWGVLRFTSVYWVYAVFVVEAVTDSGD